MLHASWRGVSLLNIAIAVGLWSSLILAGFSGCSGKKFLLKCFSTWIETSWNIRNREMKESAVLRILSGKKNIPCKSHLPLNRYKKCVLCSLAHWKAAPSDRGELSSIFLVLHLLLTVSFQICWPNRSVSLDFCIALTTKKRCTSRREAREKLFKQRGSWWIWSKKTSMMERDCAKGGECFQKHSENTVVGLQQC